MPQEGQRRGASIMTRMNEVTQWTQVIKATGFKAQ